MASVLTWEMPAEKEASLQMLSMWVYRVFDVFVNMLAVSFDLNNVRMCQCSLDRHVPYHSRLHCYHC